MSPYNSIYHKEWRQKNSDKWRAAKKRWRLKNPDKMRANSNRNYWAHRDARRAQKKIYFQLNKEAIRYSKKTGLSLADARIVLKQLEEKAYAKASSAKTRSNRVDQHPRQSP